MKKLRIKEILLVGLMSLLILTVITAAVSLTCGVSVEPKDIIEIMGPTTDTTSDI